MKTTKVTIRQVAAAAGVSPATASRVITGNAQVSPEARAAVEKAISDLQFVPSSAARNLALGRTNSVALVLPAPESRVLRDPFFESIILGISSVLNSRDLQMVLLLAHADDQSDRITDYLAGSHVDGAVVAAHYGAALHEKGDIPVPCVFMGRPLGASGLPYVDTDNREGGRLAAQRLVDRGCRRIATIAGPAGMSAAVDRYQGFCDALAEAGLEPAGTARGNFTFASGLVATQELLDQTPDIDGVFAASDPMALGALQELQARGRAVPDDVALVGFDDLEQGELATPALTSVSQMVEEVAGRASRMLLHILDGTSPHPAPVMYPPTLVIRESA